MLIVLTLVKSSFLGHLRLKKRTVINDHKLLFEINKGIGIATAYANELVSNCKKYHLFKSSCLRPEISKTKCNIK